MSGRVSPLWAILARWSVIPLVLLTLGIGVVLYSSGGEARSAIRWTSANEFMRPGGEFARAGYRIDCDFAGNQPACIVRWAPPHTAKVQPINVYQCDDESAVPRETVFRRFSHAAETMAGEDTVQHSLAVLNAFFQCGIRREIDRAVHHARQHNQLANRMPPFKLHAAGPSWTIDGVDEAQRAIPTGLPRRPEYGAPIYGRWEKARADLIEVTARSRGKRSSVWLNPASVRPCHPLWAGGSGDGDCNSVDVLACPPDLKGCSSPVMNVRPLTNGIALITHAGSVAGDLLSRSLTELAVEDMIVSDATAGRATTLYVKSREPLPQVVVDITHNTSPPLSRLQMVNGRWTRWYEPSVQQWLTPVVSSMEQFTSESRVKAPNEPMLLSLDLGLQQALEQRLDQWMKDNAEGAVIGDLAGHWTSHRSLNKPSGNERHHRPVPEAGVTVLDPATGEILAVASYPPASALRYDEGFPTFAGSWMSRLARGAPVPAMREIASDLADRVEDDLNSNFVRHPIGSTMKPILLSLVMDSSRGQSPPDGLDRFFDLVVAGHRGFGGDEHSPKCPTCTQPQAESIAGLPLGPWGDEEAGAMHANAPWIDRRAFLLASCNKYAVTLGVLTLLDWSHPPAAGGQQACCWLTPRDRFGFAASTGQPPQQLYDHWQQLPRAQSWLDANTLATNFDTTNAPIFQRLTYYYDVNAGSSEQAYDSSPWAGCVQIPGLLNTSDVDTFVGRVETTQLALTSNRISTSFTNIFTGAGLNWWTNVKLAEAYARIATNRRVNATFCGGTVPNDPLFANSQRWEELNGILSHQRAEASWVHPFAGNLNTWVESGQGRRVTVSKTGTSLRDAGYSSTGIFAIYIGGAGGMKNGDPLPNGRGLIVVAHVDDIGHSSRAVELVNTLFPLIQSRIP